MTPNEDKPIHKQCTMHESQCVMADDHARRLGMLERCTNSLKQLPEHFVTRTNFWKAVAVMIVLLSATPAMNFVLVQNASHKTDDLISKLGQHEISQTRMEQILTNIQQKLNDISIDVKEIQQHMISIDKKMIRQEDKLNGYVNGKVIQK